MRFDARADAEIEGFEAVPLEDSATALVVLRGFLAAGMQNLDNV
jgi:hypothetical protein